MVYEQISSVEIPNFIDKIKISNARRPKYFDKGTFPKAKKFLDPTKYAFQYHKIGKNNKLLLTDLKTGQPVIKNSRSAGTPKFLKIKGNAFYSGFGSPHQRMAIVAAIKDDFRPHLQKLKKIEQKDFPIYIKFDYFFPREQAQDLDNKRFAYEKCTLDLLQELKIIPNDNLDYITQLNSKYHNSKDTKILISIFKDK